MSGELRNRTIWWGGIGFLLLNTMAVVFEQYILMAIPFALAAIVAAVLALDKLMLFVIFVTPLSITLTDDKFNLGVSLPTEPLLAGITLLLFFRFLYGEQPDRRVLKHPVTWSIALWLAWMAITSITSTIPEVSFKYLMAQIWFVVPYYFLMTYLFRNEKNINRFFWLFLIPMCAVAIYTMTVHAQNGFSRSSSVWVMWPFFKEHTSWGAVLAMCYPVSLYFVWRKSAIWVRAVALVLLLILTAALILSFTRAAWLSLAAAGVVWLLIRLRVPFKLLILAAVVGLGFLYSYRVEISQSLQQNEAASSDDLGEHVQSMTNVSTDASNMERVNRWASALRMWKEKPHTGWGPGTYTFQYAPFQKPHEKTIISTNAGNRGNAHSEYIGTLSEMGWPGLFFLMILVASMIISGIRAYRKAGNSHMAQFAMCATLGLVTYFTHGFLNNFLNMDKAAAPVWGFSAVIVAINLFYSNPERNNLR